MGSRKAQEYTFLSNPPSIFLQEARPFRQIPVRVALSATVARIFRVGAPLPPAGTTVAVVIRAILSKKLLRHQLTFLCDLSAQ